MKFYIADLILLIPEFFLVNAILILLLFGVFYSNIYFYKYTKLSKVISILTILIFIIYFFLTLNTIDFNNNISNYLFINNSLIIFFKILLISFAILILIMFYNLLNINKVIDFEFFILFLISCLGMLLLIMSFDLIVAYLTIELQSLCFYILAAYNKKQNKSIEAGLKYFILGSFSSCLFVLGISIIYGLTGTTNFKDLANLFELGLANDHLEYFLICGILLITIGLFFKLSVAPFHLWLPDVFDGILKIVMVIFAILPKLSILFLFYKIYFFIFLKILINWQYVFIFFILLSWLISIAGAIKTRRLSKLIAFSAVNHIGFILLAFLFNDIFCLINYLTGYFLLLISLFSVLFSLINYTDFSELKLINNLIFLKKSNYLLAIIFMVILFSLAGIPPLSGFYIKYFLFLNSLNFNLNLFVIFGLLFSILSSFFYLRLIKLIVLNNSENWLFLINIDKWNSYILSFSIIFNFFYIFFIDFIYEFSKFLYLTSLINI